jgi:geranylgeranyl pyrophosphate synthase
VEKTIKILFDSDGLEKSEMMTIRYIEQCMRNLEELGLKIEENKAARMLAKLALKVKLREY